MGDLEIQELEGSCTLKADHSHASQVMVALRFTFDDLMAWSCFSVPSPPPPPPRECKPVCDFTSNKIVTRTTVTLSIEFTFCFTSAQFSSFYASYNHRLLLQFQFPLHWAKTLYGSNFSFYCENFAPVFA